jgi:hypothetical protein
MKEKGEIKLKKKMIKNRNRDSTRTTNLFLECEKFKPGNDNKFRRQEKEKKCAQIE